MFNYGLVFWNEETDQEQWGFFQAESFFKAEEIMNEKNYVIEGFVRGALHFIEDSSLMMYQSIDKIMVKGK